MIQTPRLLSALAFLGLAATAAPSLGDVLVLEDGSQIETDGPWEVRGAIVVFTLPSGALSSIRATKVDLDASARATVKAQEPTTPVRAEPATPSEPVVTLTDRDVARVDPRTLPAWQIGGEEESGSEGDGTEAPEGLDATDDSVEDSPDPAPPVDRLQVTSWRDSGSDDEVGGTRIVGTLVNSSQEIASQIQVTVLLLDAGGNLIATTDADVTAPSLRPGQSTAFRAEVLGVESFDQVRFETEHVALAWRNAPESSNQDN